MKSINPIVLFFFALVTFIGSTSATIAISWRETPKKHFIEINQKIISEAATGGGVSWGDYNNDGNLDLISSWGRVSLLKNNGDGSFVDVTGPSGLGGTGHSVRTALFVDYDNDGYSDLYFVNHGKSDQLTDPGERDLLYRNNGDGTFTDVTTAAGVLCDGHGEGAAASDYNHDGLLDIFVVNYGVNMGQKGSYRYDKNCFLKNNGNGTFTEIASLLGLVNPTLVNRPEINYPDESEKRRALPFQPVFLDFDNDGWDDLFIAIDFGSSVLYRNLQNGTFEDVTDGAGLNRFGTGMGVAAGDYNHDEFTDLYVTNDGANYFWRNNRNGTFTEIASTIGVSDKNAVGWGTSFLDYDNDGKLDLVVANGLVDENDLKNDFRFSLAAVDSFFRQQRPEKFIDVTNTIGISDDGIKDKGKVDRGLAIADYDNDGAIDLAISQNNDQVLTVPSTPQSLRLYRNSGNNHNWITMKLQGVQSNRMGVGARVMVTSGKLVQWQQVLAGSSYLSQNSPWLTFGLENHKIVEQIVVQWPSGIRQTIPHPPINEIITITEPLPR